MKSLLSVFAAFAVTFSWSAFAVEMPVPQSSSQIEELNPFDPEIETLLQEMDAEYEAETGMPAILHSFKPFGPACRQIECPVWAKIDKSTQTMELYVNGVLNYRWLVSTGAVGSGTPNFDQNPNGRIYDAYSSTKFPGGDYMGLGNMPYAVFISGGFAIHGTTAGNLKKLGQRASHGCIRLHPENGKIFNRLVRQYGIYKTWITVY